MGNLLDSLQNAIRKGFRNGNWKELDSGDRSWIRCVEDYLKTGQEIVKLRILSPLMKLIKRLTSTAKQRIMEDGFDVAKEIMNEWDGIFEWCPQMREWLRDEDYIFYLGISPLNWKGGGKP